MKYLLDSSVLIQAKNEYYKFEFCPAFWELLETLNNDQKLISIDRVFTEILDGDDYLISWSKNKGRNLFENTNTPNIQNSMNIINKWLENNKEFDDAMVANFIDGADIWLIASAISWDCTVVTQEKVRKSKAKIQIPDVCIQFKINCISTFDMLEECNRKFILEK